MRLYMEFPSVVLLIMDNDRFADRYKIESSKLNNWDYSTPGKYFITICAHNKGNFFGKVENNKIRLKEIGLVAKNNWLEITRHFDNVKLDEFVVMPNHVHGIIEITKPCDHHVETRYIASLQIKKQNDCRVKTQGVNVETLGMGVETHNYASLRNKKTNLTHITFFLHQRNSPVYR